MASRQYRAARTVHLWWNPSNLGPYSAFHIDVRVTETTNGTYFCGAGFAGGYFGIQDLGGRSHRVIFSVWDTKSQMGIGRDQPNQVRDEDRVQILYEAAHVRVQRFGGEGTGAQCFDDTTGWEVGSTVRLCVMHKFEPDGHACYAAFFNGTHLASYRVRQGKPFSGFYSFIEDFRRDHKSVEEIRTAVYGPAWVYNGSCWAPASSATFTASKADFERPDNIDCNPGLSPGTFVLRTGGSLAGQHKLKKSFPLGLNVGNPPQLPAAEQTLFQKRSPAKKDHLSVPQPGTKCPLCQRASKRGGFCGGSCCNYAQCQVNNGIPIPGQRCIWKCATGSIHCLYHQSGGKRCPLCGYTVKGNGPYCYDDGSCCGSSQCQATSPFLPGRRCDWVCYSGPLCAYHA